jgi:hypothetical protein
MEDKIIFGYPGVTLFSQQKRVMGQVINKQNRDFNSRFYIAFDMLLCSLVWMLKSAPFPCCSSLFLADYLLCFRSRCYLPSN